MNFASLCTTLFGQIEQQAAMQSFEIAKWFNGLPAYISIPAVLILVFVLPFVIGAAMGNAVRMPTHGWKFGLIISAMVGAIVTIILGWPPKLGVDLKGGYIMVWKIDAKKQAERASAAGVKNNRMRMGEAEDNVQGLIDSLKRRLNPDGLKEISIRPYFGTGEVEIIIPETDKAEIDKIKKQILSQGFLEFLILAENRTDVELFDLARKQAANEANSRLRIVRNGKDEIVGKWVRVGTEEKPRAGVKPLRIKGGWDSFLIRNGATGELLDTRNIPSGEVAGAKYFIDQKINVVEILTKVTTKEIVNGTHLDLGGVQAGMDDSGWPDVHFAFKGEGSSRMGALTGNNLNRQLAIVLDDTLLSHANIKDRISDRGQITGKFTQDEVDFVVRILKAGSLPATLQEQPVYEDPSDPTLGAENIQKGFQAIVISLAVVFGFAFWYYRFAGFVACFALAMNILLTVAVMILFGATLTMPGLAGMVLTVGMSVDSNVLIFERIREELGKGASLRMAIRNGFDRAMTTIIDSNLTTLLTALILYIIGTDQLVGFAVTLILGIVTSMFTAIFVSRVIFEVAERTGFTKSLDMMQLFATTNFDFVKYQWNFIAVSVVFIVAGLAAAFYRGGGIFDIDLRGGTSIQVILREPMSDTEMRKILDGAFEGKTYKDSRVDYTLKPVKAADADGKRTTYRVDSIYPETEIVQDWLTKALVDAKGESLLKRYRVEFEPVVKAGEKQGALHAGDESTFFTSLKQNEADKAAETKAEDSKAESKPEEPKKDSETKPAEDKAEEKTAPETKSEEKKEEAPVAKTPANEGKSDPGEKVPAAPTQPATNVATMVTSVIKFSDNSGMAEGIDAQALKTRLEEAAKTLNIETLQIDLNHKDWDQKNMDVRFSEWTVGLSASTVDTQKILQRLQQDMESSPVWAASKKIGGQIAGNFVRIAFFAIMASLVGIIVYIWVRFQNVQWGFAAVIALVHDVLCMLAGIALSYWFADVLGVLGVVEFKIDLTVVAAFLTLIGYSINDTIVVFDRMREVKGKMPNLTKQVVNDSINQTLSRTVLTFFTTFMVVVVLYAAGGNGIHGFAFAMLIGTVVGVYSSIYIAAPFLLWMIEHNPPTKKTF